MYVYSALLGLLFQVGIIAFLHQEPLLGAFLSVLNIIFSLLVYPMLLVALFYRSPIPAKYGPHQ